MKAKIELKIKEAIKKIFNKVLDIEVEIPPKIEMGDFAFPCFKIAKEVGKDPKKVAQKIKKELSQPSFIKEIKITGAYLNFVIKREFLFDKIIREVLGENSSFFSPDLKEEKIMIEFISPNSNKPLHIGHLRNACLGNANAKILKQSNKKVTKACLINDKGIPIFKSILAWDKWHSDESPQKNNIKPDHFLGNLYVEYENKLQENPELKEEVQELVQKWENGDSKVIKKWEKINNWFLEGFRESIDQLNFDFDLIQYESKIYKQGREIIKKGLEKGVFKKKEGKIIVDLPEEKFGEDKKALLLREDGTSVYLTQDIGLAVKRFQDHNLDKLLYIVGSEQKNYFKRLFTILELLDYKWSKNCIHIAYGLVNLPQGSMSSRKGNVVKLDELVEEVRKLARKEIKKRYDLPEEKIGERAEKITASAIKFYLLKVTPSKNIKFDPKESISFEGATGPYCQYAYARTQSILKKADKKVKLDEIDFSSLGKKEEIILLKSIMNLSQRIESAAKEFNPAFIADAVYDTAKDFNVFYNKHSVIFADSKKGKESRLALTKATAIAIKKGLALLGIKTLEEM